jgi:hypothetical protein
MKILKEDHIMSLTTDEVIANSDINFISRRIFNEYKFSVGKLKTVITIRTYQEKEGGHYIFEQSHNIKTPSQIGPYKTSSPWGENEADAVQRAITSITQYYNQAIKNSDKPVESWLIANKRFIDIK